MMLRLIVPTALLLFAPSNAAAGELIGGLYAHDVKTPLTKSGVESGVDLQIGYRGGSIGNTPLQPYVFAAVNSAGKTHYAAAGLSAKFGERLFIRPGIGIAVHSGSARKYEIPANGEIEFGSRILFEPEVGIGYQVNERTSIEASWVHMSHAQLFGKQNPGIDNIGLRFGLRL
nr:acyloxyacyl hydrolase [uncultured Sphingomonas sp.]